MSNLDEYADQILLSPTQLKAALAEHERQAAVLAVAVHRLETTGSWPHDEFPTIREWLCNKGRMSSAGADALIAKGRALDG